METYHIHINGIVQGVGFRPMVYQLAKALRLNGYVRNGNDGVNIVFNASEQDADLFFIKIKLAAPEHSKIILSEIKKTSNKTFSNFSIIVEDDNTRKNVLMSPDVAICSTCRNELHDVKSRRHRYPFITCTKCGPRYSIITSLPYERQDTVMQTLKMCKRCNEEYTDVADRRFFSQTNSCADCGIALSLHENASCAISNDTEYILSQIKNFLRQGKILAVKGIGGYLLLCDAKNRQTIQLLRNRKHRPSKPFAILYPDIESVESNFELNDHEKALLESGEAPIVLLYPTKEAFKNLAVKNIAPGLKRLGVMIPSTPLLELIATDYGKPLIATSANISGSPIIYRDEDALIHLFEIADYIVSYNLEITIPQDDSVVQISKYAKQKIILRRSRGYAPSFLQYKPRKSACILSTGAFLKSSFTLSVNGNVFVSQLLGSGESYDSQLMYMHTLEHWVKMYQVKPELIIADLHPDYFTHQYAVELAEKYGTDLKFVQHHEAHFAAVLAENDLVHSTGPVLGVIWDGTGLGTDGNIWGGEFFKYENNEIERCYHFDYFPAIAGDKMAREPRIAALCAASGVITPSGKLKGKFTETEWNNYQSVIDSTNLFTSSVGRIFDAVASLLDVCDKQTYEGESAMYLQVLAEDYVNEKGFVMVGSYFQEDSHFFRIAVDLLMLGIMQDLEAGNTKEYIAAKFHYSLVCLIDIIARKINVENICFSGGVFQNALLTDWIQKEHSSKYKLHFHKNLSPNDENISFGQMVYFDNEITTIHQQLVDNQLLEKY